MNGRTAEIGPDAALDIRAAVWRLLAGDCDWPVSSASEAALMWQVAQKIGTVVSGRGLSLCETAQRSCPQNLWITHRP